MKKILCMVGLIMSICLCVGICACGEHKHDTGNWIDEVPATCSSNGVKGHYHCDECGKDVDRNGNEIEDLILQKSDHVFSYINTGNGKHVKACIFDCGTRGDAEECNYVTSSVLKQATCSESGEELRVCAFCHDEKKVTIPGAHIFDSEAMATPATCSKAGNIEYRHCSVCDQKISPDGKILKNDEWILPATGEHSFGEGVVTKSPTCKDKGEKTLTCLFCGKEEKQDLPLTDHFPVKVPETLATCFETGLTSGEVCAVCDAVIKKQEVIPKLEHDFSEWETIVEPDENFGGLKVRTCTLCATSENEEVEPSEHKWGAWEYAEGDKNKRTCTECGEEEVIPCLYSVGNVIAPTCTEKGHTESVCQLCGHKIMTDETQPLGHSFGEWKADKIIDEQEKHEHTHTRICKHCGESETVKCSLEQYKVIAPTCEIGGYTINRCKECGSEHEDALTPATGHTWGEYQHAEEHNHTRICSVCNKTESAGCYFSSETIPATCTENGKTVYTCDTCKYSYDTNIVPALKHVFSEWKFDETSAASGTRTHTHTCTRCEFSETKDCEMVDGGDAPTCTAQGSLKKYCKDCMTGETKDNENASLGHQWGEWKVDESDSSKHTHTCERCNVTESAEHSYTDEVKTQADCLNPTKITKTCSVCKNVIETSSDSPLGHDWQEWTITKDSHSHTCSRCHTTETASHNYTETNFCVDCNHDCLTYSLIGSHFVLLNDENLPNSVTKVIILETHTEGEATHAVTEIERYAFYRKESIKEVVLPESVTLIDDFAFDYCTSLETVSFSNTLLRDTSENTAKGLTAINMCAFEGCKNLKTFPIPDTVESIGYRCFSGCTALKDFDLKTSVKSIGSGAFENTGLIADNSKWNDNIFILGNHLIDTNQSEKDEYTIPENIVSIGKNAFTDWTNLKTLTIPASVTYFDSNAFKGCDHLATVTYKGDFNGWMKITFVDDAASPLLNVTTFTISGAEGEITIDEGIKSIPAGTFRGTKITKITIPSSVTYIGEEAFENCALLKEVTIPDTVTYIGKDAFKGSGIYLDENKWVDGVLYIGKHLIKAKETCVGEYKIKEDTLTICGEAFKDSRATLVTIPATVTRIGARAFCDCDTLTGVKFEDTSIKYFANKIDLIARVYDVYDDAAANLKNLKYMDGEWRFYSRATK